MILHVDMDAFYASVEQRDRPELVGKPVVVGGSPDGRGVVSAASYEARKFGIHSAMPARRAQQLCRDLIFVRPRMDHYVQVSRQIRDIFERFTPIIEPLSLDEAFLDVAGTSQLFGSAIQIGREIKAAIRSELRLVASVGIAPNKFLAKIASDLQKPDAFVVVKASEIQAFLDPLPVGRIWGVGRVGQASLRKFGVTSIADLRQLPAETLEQLFGASGQHYWELARGRDDRPVTPDREAKTISSETTFAADIDDRETLKSWLVVLVEQVARRVRNHHRKGRTLEIKVRYSDFQSFTRSQSLSIPTDITDELVAASLSLFDRRVPTDRLPVRLLGFGLTGFTPSEFVQQSLFDEPQRDSLRNLDSATDAIVQRFGKDSLKRAIQHQVRPRPKQPPPRNDNHKP
jgi:DNA polymerase-4